MALQLQLDTTEFLDKAWQQQPRFYRQAFAPFDDLIEPELLAGLALEDGVDSRVIEHRDQEWLVSHGPFESYEAFGDTDWTLLVQSVNEWVPEVQQLIAPFRFLPDWRIDDVMISFATENGSVGPHLDQYDVFIIQGSGRRHWQVGKRVTAANEFYPHPDLKQLADDFEPIIDVVLEPGDMLYIPAGCPHHGVALEPSMNYSVGFRAPNTAEFAAAVADQLSHSNVELSRYRDAHASNYGASHQVTAQQLAHLREFLLQSMQATDLDEAMLLVMSQSKRPLPQPDQFIQLADLYEAAEAADILLCRTPGARVLIGPNDVLYSNGEAFSLTPDTLAFANELGAIWADTPLVELQEKLEKEEAAELLCDLINAGIFYLVEQHD